VLRGAFCAVFKACGLFVEKHKIESKMIVHFDKMRGFNAVNIREGYGQLMILSPLEVV
jgi:hypothetical protein